MMGKRRYSLPGEKVSEKPSFKYSRFKAGFYNIINLDSDTRTLIKYLNTMQGN